MYGDRHTLRATYVKMHRLAPKYIINIGMKKQGIDILVLTYVNHRYPQRTALAAFSTPGWSGGRLLYNTHRYHFAAVSTMDDSTLSCTLQHSARLSCMGNIPTRPWSTELRGHLLHELPYLEPGVEQAPVLFARADART